MTTRSLLWLAASISLLAGLTEVSIHAVQRWGFGHRIWLSEHFVWMIPLALLLLHLLVALIVAGVGKLARRPVSLATGASVFFTMAFAGPLLSTGKLHIAASTVLALGLGIQAGRLVSRGGSRVVAALRPITLTLASLVMLGGVAVGASAALRERRTTAALPNAQGDAPNVLVIILDTVRAASMSVYGYSKRTTPYLEQFVSEATLFERAFSTSSWTLPSHGSIFTGHPAHELSADLLTPLDATYPTLAEHFRSRGYLTAGFSANLDNVTKEVGLGRGFTHFDDYPVSPAMVMQSAWLTRLATLFVRRLTDQDQKLVRRTARSMTTTVLDWIDGQPKRPYFAFVNYYDAHAPYLPPDSLAERFGPRRTRRAVSDLGDIEHWSASDIAAERAAYEAMLLELDGEVGRLVESLRARGTLDNTIVVIASDHGEQFGEHGLVDHGNSLYRALLEVPLMIRYPSRVRAGVRVPTPVSLRDLAATLVDISQQSPAPFPGVSLNRIAEAAASTPSPILSEVREGVRPSPWLPIARGRMSSLLTPAYHYIEYGDGVEELFHFSDSLETNDLAPAAEFLPALERMRDSTMTLTGHAPRARRNPS